ncbi:hypothetical protein ACP70R_042825 [Stipagrostis hirtigluma subsp. patula]
MRMAAASPDNLSGGDGGDGWDELRVSADAEARQMSDQGLKDRVNRARGAFAKGIHAKLPDGGRKLCIWRDAALRELERRAALAAPRPHGRNGEPRVPQDDDGCERVVRSRCAESSGLAVCDSNKNQVTTKVDFLSASGESELTGVDISSLEIRSPNKPNALVDNDGKMYGEKASCEPSSQANLSHEELCLENSAKMEMISVDDASKDSGHTSMCGPSATPSRKRKRLFCWMETHAIQNLLKKNPLTAAAATRQQSELLQRQQSMLNAAHDCVVDWDVEKLYYPSREHPNSIEISTDDIRCLQPESLLSSPIMNLYIMYLQGPLSSIIRPRGEYHIFNTYFFNKLEALTSKRGQVHVFFEVEKMVEGCRHISKGISIVACACREHTGVWSLYACQQKKIKQVNNLDSFVQFCYGPSLYKVQAQDYDNSGVVSGLLTCRIFLKEEWNYLNQNFSSAEIPLRESVWKNLPRKVEKKTIEVPQQENDYDCGLFVLYYMQRFIQEAPERLQKKDISMFGKGWFRPEEPSKLRREISRLLRSCKGVESKNDATRPATLEHSPETVDVAATEVPASSEQNGKSD